MTSSHDIPQEDTHNDKSCFFKCYVDKDTGEVFFGCGWGASVPDIENLAFIMSQLSTGKYEDAMLTHIIDQCDDMPEELELFLNLYEKNKTPLESGSLVIKPSQQNLQ